MLPSVFSQAFGVSVNLKTIVKCGKSHFLRFSVKLQIYNDFEHYFMLTFQNI